MLRSALSLLSVSSLLVALAEPVQVDSGVTWLTPSKGDVYNPGDTLVGRWKSDESDPSLSFRLCVVKNNPSRRSDHSEYDHDHDKEGKHKGDKEDDSEDDNDDGSEDDNSGEGGSQSDNGDSSCGEAVWPYIAQTESDGSYSIQMALPNATSVSQCYLQMVSNNGDKSSSPTFFLGSSSADDQSAAVADEGSSTDPQSSSSSSSTLASSSSPEPSPAPESSLSPESSAPPDSTASPKSPTSPASSTLSARSSSSPTASASLSNANLQSTSSQPPTPNPNPASNETRMPAPTAAYAVPLSLVLSVLLAAGGLSLHQRRKLRAERKLEHEALKTRATLSRHSTLSFAGFMALGRGPSPPGSVGSRTTSVNLMRAWRRDVSRYDHETSSGIEDDDTYVAKTSDARSVISSSSLPKREPRPQTREPFYVSSNQAHRTTVPAGLFRMGVSPMVPQREDDDDDWGKLKRGNKRGHDRDMNDETINASVNDEVMSRYFEFSPIPLSPPAAREVSQVSVPERLHVRRYAETENELYDVVARKLSR